jgi:hypothetical protein
MNKNKPAHQIRIGAIKALIWENTFGEEGNVRHNVTFSKIFKEGNEWRDTNSFGRDDLLVLRKVADQAHTWIFDQRTGKQERQ